MSELIPQCYPLWIACYGNDYIDKENSSYDTTVMGTNFYARVVAWMPSKNILIPFVVLDEITAEHAFLLDLQDYTYTYWDTAEQACEYLSQIEKRLNGEEQDNG